jgi:AbrB family looped-hinge helix DNA binding protein
MLTATVTSKGQLTLPVEIRREFGITAGTRVEFVPGRSGAISMRPMTTSARELAGILPRPSVPVAIEEMEAGIAAGAAQKLAR